MPPRTAGVLMFAAAVSVFAAQTPACQCEQEIDKLRAEVSDLRELLHHRLLNASTLESREQTKDDGLSLEALATCLDYMWLLLAGALVMFMQAGFAILESGNVTHKNAGTVLLKNLVDGCMGAVCWYFLGYGIAYGLQEDPSKFVGSKNFAGNGFFETDSSDAITGTSHFNSWFFQWAFCATSATIVSGGVAERMAFPAYVLYSVIMTGVIYPFIVYWTWSGSGWLTIGSGDAASPNGYSDFAGSGIVHLTGGIGALVGAAVLGPRDGRWDRPDQFQPSNASMVVLGTFILWFGWYGFNCGSTLKFSDVGTATQASLVAMNTTLSAAAGGITVFLLRLRTGSYDMCGMCNGILAGLVAVCAGVADMEPSLALVTGVLGAVASEGGHLLMQMLKIDDPLDAFAVHGCGGIMGVLVRPLFDRRGLDTTMLGWHLIGALAIAGWTASWSLAVLVPLKLLGLLRIDREEEKHGGDTRLSHHSPLNVYVPNKMQESSTKIGKEMQDINGDLGDPAPDCQPNANRPLSDSAPFREGAHKEGGICPKWYCVFCH